MIEVLGLVDQRKLERLKDDQLFISDRLAQLEALIIQLNLPPLSYRRQELASERSTLEAHHRVVSMQILEITGNNPEHDRAMKDAERTEALRQRMVDRYRKECIERGDDYDRQGDYRNASITRLEALNARKVAEHEIH